MKNNARLVGEFVLIVAGVLVALMVEVAPENRKDNNLRDEYLVRLRDDIQLDKLAIERHIEFFTDVQRFSGNLAVSARQAATSTRPRPDFRPVSYPELGVMIYRLGQQGEYADKILAMRAAAA